MAEIVKKEIDVKESETTSTVEEPCFVDIPQDEIKLENVETKGNLDKNRSVFCNYFYSFIVP